MESQGTQPTKPSRMQLSLDYRIIIFILLAVIAGMLLVWKPWSANKGSDRTISVTGESKITAEPDEYVFHPSYQFKNTDKQTALNEVTKKSEEVVKKLKELGVADSKIKTDTDGYGDYHYYDETTKTNTYNLRLTITLSSRDEAQKIQDYLLTTTPSGSVSPQATFSETKRKELENKARDEATKDARAKAEQSGKNLGFKVGGVKSVEDGSGFGNDMPYGRGAISLDSAVETKLAVQPGENDLRYSVIVVYFLK